MRCHARYGDTEIEFTLPTHAEILAPGATTPLPDPPRAVTAALAAPLGVPPLADVAATRGKVAIIVNDETRVARTDVFLPLLVEALNHAGVPDRRISVTIANGTHRPMTNDEIRRKVSAFAAERVAVYNHHARRTPTVHVGTTAAGTDVALNARVMAADRIILTGSIVYHFFAGYGGGRKSLFPGVAAYRSIEQNHVMSVDPRATFGKLRGNPVEEDIQEAVAFRKPDFLLNTVLDEDRRIVGVVAGDYRQAHEAGCRIVDRVYGRAVREPADLVIASCGGYPKDINVFQAHKTMENAVRITRPGGVVILLAECRDGVGPASFVDWLRRHDSSKAMEAELRRRFQFGAHKAFFLARLTEKADIYLVSSLPPRNLEGLFVKPAPSIGAALAAAYDTVGPHPRTYVLPQGGLVFPHVAAS